jgi:hypothetical protein
MWILSGLCLSFLMGLALSVSADAKVRGHRGVSRHHKHSKAPSKAGRSLSAASSATAASVTLAGNSAIESGVDTNPSGSPEAFPVGSLTTGTASSISVYVDASNTATTMVVGLYSTANGQPASLMAQGSISGPQAGAWNAVSVPSTPLSAGIYWIAVLGRHGTLAFRDRSGGSCFSETSAVNRLTSLAQSWKPGVQWLTCPISAYISGSGVSTAPPPPPVTPPTAPPANTGLPTITGTAMQGQKLSTSTGTWSGSPTAYVYQWQDCNASGGSCSNISSANASSYMLTSTDVGKTMRAVVAAGNSGGSAAATSSPSSMVASLPVTPPPPSAAPANTALPTITGTATQGQTLASSTGTWSGSPTGYTYQWQDCNSSGGSCSNISGATSSSYTLTASDVGATVMAAVTATNAGGSASASSAATAVVAALPTGGGGGGGGGLPAGVTLQQIDGGPNYYCSHGFTYACNDGWDSSSFFPVGSWYGSITSASDVARWKDLGLNTLYRTTSNTNLSLVRSSGLYSIVDDEGSPETSGMGSETVGLLASDEPSTMSGWTGSLSSTPNAQQDGRFWYLNNTWNFIAYEGLNPLSSSSAVLSSQVSTPNGTKRHDDVQSVDLYWFAGVPADAGFQGQQMYGLSSAMTATEMKCGCRYGDIIDRLRAFQTTYPAPIASFVENGGPYIQDTSASTYITPPELNWAVWSSIIHGARQIIYFNHSFAGPASSDDNFSQPYYQTVQAGQTTSIYAQAKATDGLVAQLAPVINSPTALGYVSTNHPSTTFGGVETMAKDANGQFYVFADTRNAETSTNLSTTFTTADGYTGPVTVVGEGRTLQATNGVFTDTFAQGSTVHIYKMG